MADVSITNVTKAYGDVQVIHGVDLKIDDGEFVVFVGPSGCGKSTLLRMIAGLEEISGGEVAIAGRSVNDVSPSKRGVAMVFQTYALYPHMTVYNNMAFGLRQAKTDKDEIDRRVKSAAEILQITDYLERMPKNLSGGQRQRVAIGRAIVRDPQVFLFDEPLSNLDAALRVQTRIEIARLHERLKSTMIYVTHDQVEAMTLADKIVVLRDGLIEQVGSPMDLYETPSNMFVAGFIGSPKMNFLPAEGKNGIGHIKGGGQVKAMATGPLTIGIRPEDFQECDASSALFSGTLELVEQLGEYSLAHLTGPNGEEVTAKLDRKHNAKTGSMLHFTAPAETIHIFDENEKRVS